MARKTTPHKAKKPSRTKAKARKTRTKKTPNRASTSEALLASTDVAKVAEGIAAIKTLPQPKKKKNEPLWAWPKLDAALARVGSTLPAKALLAVFTKTFPNVGQSWAAALTAAEEIARREDLDAHLKLVDALLAAMKTYDSGHRSHEGTVFDRLIDGTLAKLYPEAIAQLLSKLDADHLSADGDGFGKLFDVALPKVVGSALHARLLRLFMGDTELPKPKKPLAPKRKSLEASIKKSKLELPGPTDEFNALHALVRGAEFSTSVKLTYLELLVPHCRGGTDRLQLIDFLWELADSEPDALLKKLEAWKAEDRDLGEALLAASWIEDTGGEQPASRKVMSEKFHALALKHFTPSNELGERVAWLLQTKPSQESRARELVVSSPQPLKLPTEGRRMLASALEKLQKGGAHERVLAWVDALSHLSLEAYDKHTLLDLFAKSTAAARDADSFMALDVVAPKNEPKIAIEMSLAAHAIGNEQRAMEWLDDALRAGVEIRDNWTAELGPLRSDALLGQRLAQADEMLRAAAFEGADIGSEEIRAALFSGRPDFEPQVIEEKFAQLADEDEAEEAMGFLVGKAGRHHLRVLELILASEKPRVVPWRDLSQLLKRLDAAGNSEAVLAWARAFPRFTLDEPGTGEKYVLPFGFEAAAAQSDTALEDELLKLIPKDYGRPFSTGAELSFLLARLWARRGDAKKVLSYAKHVVETYETDEQLQLRKANEIPELAPQAAKIAKLFADYEAKNG